MDSKSPRITIQVTEEFKHLVKVKAAEKKISIKSLVHSLLEKWVADDQPRSA